MEEKFICKECGIEFNKPENLGKHVKHHMLREDYYNKWIKKDDKEGICGICGEKTNFNGVLSGYRKYCSLKCKRIGAGNETSNTFLQKKEKREEKYQFQCKECNEKFETSVKLNNHIIKNYGKIFYYDKWLKKDKEGICKICGEKTEFTGRMSGPHSGYRDCCSKNCANKYCYDKRTETNLEKYGVVNAFQRNDVKEKIKNSFIEHYGVDNNMKSIKGRKEFSDSMQLKYGIDWPLQDKNILFKNQKSAKTIKQFRDTDLWYQGSYELDFLEKYYDKFEITRGPSIKYKFKKKNKVYHPDFYIPSLNLIVEIKSSWTLNIDVEIKEKKKATIANGFKYLMILNKDYSSFLN